MPTTHVILLNGAEADDVGLLPFFLDEEDARPAREQLDANYQHGGGWRPFDGFKMKGDVDSNLESVVLAFPGDPPLHLIAIMALRLELVMVFEHGWVCILQSSGDHEIARMD